MTEHPNPRIITAHFPEDAGHVRALWHAYRDYLHEINCYDFGGETIDPELADLPRHYPASDGGVYLAVEYCGGAGVYGTIALNRLDAHTGEIRRLYVYPEHQGKKLGRALLAFAVEEARRLGYKRVRLDTFRAQALPQALYKSLGFRECAPYNDYPLAQVMFFEREL